MKKAMLPLLAAGMLAAGEADAAKKYIFSGWDLGELSAAKILQCADLFDKTGCDGIALNLGYSVPGRPNFSIVGSERLEFSRVEPLVEQLQALAAHPSLKESMLYLQTAPRARLAWGDDAAWTTFATNMGVAARLSKAGHFKGLVTDFEDYWRQYQYEYNRDTDGGDFDTARALARRRGAEVFGAVFAEFPEAVVLSFQLLMSESAYGNSEDPVRVMRTKEDLFPAFVNGIFDVIPPEARVVDGCEGMGYHGEASKNGFYVNAQAQLVNAMPLVAEENRAKYRAQLSVGFGLYIDSYTAKPGTGWYKGPVRGKRITHFEDNLRQATHCCDEYIWFWGEYGYYVDWPKSIMDWGSDFKPWNEALDGNFDQLCLGVKDPHGYVSRERASRVAAGTLVNMLTAAPKPGAKGNIDCRVNGMETDGWYGVRVLGRGEALWGRCYFQENGAWRYDLGGFDVAFGAADAEGWREGTALIRVAEGATGIAISLSGYHGRDKYATVELKELEVFKIRGQMTQAGLQAALDAAAPGATVCLENDVVLTAPLVVTQQVTLSGRSYSLTRDAAYAAGTLIDLSAADADLTLRSVTISGNKAAGKISSNLLRVAGGRLTLGAGTTVEDAYGTVAGTIRVAGGELVMEDGATIRGLENGTYGTAVCVFVGGTFTMRGGLITDCAGHGGTDGTVYVYNGTFAPTGGSVINNTSERATAGVDGYTGSVNFSGGFVCTNNVGVTVGDVYRSYSCAFRLTGDYTGFMTLNLGTAVEGAVEKAIWTSDLDKTRKGGENIRAANDPTLYLDFSTLSDGWYGHWRALPTGTSVSIQ